MPLTNRNSDRNEQHYIFQRMNFSVRVDVAFGFRNSLFLIAMLLLNDELSDSSRAIFQGSHD
ncbi:hypothetical protein CAF53_19755 [Sphingobium sp. LB126]|nr:hypothetical protein CAF53_19755 [Sphingobium sp. LB126]